MSPNSLKAILGHVYKAKDCTDINDVETAINQVTELAKVFGWTTALQKRAGSLSKKKRQLEPVNLIQLFNEMFGTLI